MKDTPRQHRREIAQSAHGKDIANDEIVIACRTPAGQKFMGFALA